MPVYFPSSVLIEERAFVGAITLRLDCGSVTISPGGITADQVEAKRLVGLNWVPRRLSFAVDDETFGFDVHGVAIIRPSRAVFPFA